ncbi:MAG: chemotaxis response regulator protein-glutamate methylesterase [Verrucomicrobia bacterium]|nr:chemotaxis response regulator protein-glutamate methylesterase [Verrucomicrobiota bacterium]
MSTLIKALVVDDSAFVRKVVKEMLGRSPLIEVVGVARDGAEALELVEKLKPSVVTCDLMMPGMDGIGFVREQMKRRPLPILILTATPEDGEKALEAMEAGAVDIVQKPTARATNEILSIRDELVDKVKGAAQASASKLQPITAPPRLPRPTIKREVETKIIVIGISTGGPQALRYLIPQFPANFPVPIAMVLHMPVGYTEMFAQKLNEISMLKVIEAKDGSLLHPGTALLAAAGRHLMLRRAGGEVVAQLSATPFDTPHRPSADVLFQSASECYGSKVLGVVMTGMGDDGKKGAAWIKAQGGTVLTEAEGSCVIYGMPRSVVEAGLSDASATLDEMLQTILDRL